MYFVFLQGQRTTDFNWESYPDGLVAPLGSICHPTTDAQEGRMKWPLNGRGEDAKKGYPKKLATRQTGVDEFS